MCLHFGVAQSFLHVSRRFDLVPAAIGRQLSPTLRRVEVCGRKTGFLRRGDQTPICGGKHQLRLVHRKRTGEMHGIVSAKGVPLGNVAREPHERVGQLDAVQLLVEYGKGLKPLSQLGAADTPKPLRLGQRGMRLNVDKRRRHDAAGGIPHPLRHH